MHPIFDAWENIINFNPYIFPDIFFLRIDTFNNIIFNSIFNGINKTFLMSCVLVVEHSKVN